MLTALRALPPLVPRFPPACCACLQMNVASAMDLDDLSGLESLTHQILASEAGRSALPLPSPADAARLAGGGAG